MLPDNELSSEIISGVVIGAKALTNSNLSDYEDGGVDLNDTSLGLRYQIWMGLLVGDSIVITSTNGHSYTLHSGYGISEFSFSFDQNMRPVLAWVQGGVAKLQWFDSSLGIQVITDLGNTILNPKVYLDDKRSLSNNSSDIILGYFKSGNLYYRQQRDRYLIEYLLATDVYTMTNGVRSNELVKIGMAGNLRLHFVVRNLNN